MLEVMIVWTSPNIYKAFIQQKLKLGRNRVTEYAFCIHIHERMSLPKVTWRRGSESSWNFAPGSESSRERRFQGTKVLGTFAPWSESSRERKFQGAKVLGTFAPGSESSRERKFQGAKVPYHGTFAPGSESS